MNNPIFRNYQSRIIYTSVWILITIFQILVVLFVYELPVKYALADSLIYNVVCACMLVVFWFPVLYNPLKNRNWYYNLLFHLGLIGLLLLPFWLGSSSTFMYFLAGSDKIYLHFMVTSIWWKIIEGIIFYIIIVLVYYLYIYIEKLNENAKNEIRLNQIIRDSELNLLKSQINPHFLFNSLNSVNALIINSPSKAQEMLVGLSDYLRYTVLSIKQISSSLQNEIENIKRYLSIEKLRFGDKLSYEINLEPECSSIEIPAMLLQPLFENAIKHGVYESIQTVHIHSEIKKEDDYLFIEISNNFDEDNFSSKKGSGTGLKNIRERLRLTYGNGAILQTKIQDNLFIVTLKIATKDQSHKVYLSINR